MIQVIKSVFAVLDGSAIVISKEADTATVFCGRKCDMDFAVKSLAASLKSLLQTA